MPVSKRAKNIYQKWHGKEHSGSQKIMAEIDPALVYLGDLHKIEYSMPGDSPNRGGGYYVHVFPGPTGMFCDASGTILILYGNFKVTENGIE